MMNNLVHVPPGFRFHPTDEELVDYYLRRKITSIRIELDVIKDVDLYRIEPWDLQEVCRIGKEEENEWYFFSHKDKKYPTGSRTNRATAAGFWKATGRDKAIHSKQLIIGMRKTLVFYKGRAPNGLKSDWIMHEYRLIHETDHESSLQEEGWVVCRVFKKRIAAAATRKLNEFDDSPIWYDYSCKKEMDNLQYNAALIDHHFLQLPNLESPKMQQPTPIPSYGPGQSTIPGSSSQTQTLDDHLVFDHHQVTDWRVLDKFVASQLSNDQGIVVSKDNEELNHLISEENGSSSLSSCHIDLWE